MKKLLVLVLVLVVSVMANAATINLQGAGTELTAINGQTISVNIIASAAMTIDAKIAFTGGLFSITSATNAASVDAGMSQSPAIAGSEVQFISANFGGLNGTVGTVNFVYNGGKVVLSLVPTALQGGSFSADGSDMTVGGAGVFTVVPEPITVALLGLGGLFIRRRKVA